MQLKKAPALGRGLDALFGHINIEKQNVPNHALQQIAVEAIRPDKRQPRKFFNDQDLSELAQSIAEKGVLQPILVRPQGEYFYELVAGERRWRAAQKSGLKTIPAIVKNLSDQQALEIAVIENIQRQDLSPLEEAQSYERLIHEFSYTQERLAQTLSKSRSHVANTLRLLVLPEKVKLHLAAGTLTAGHARALINHPNAETIADQIVEQKLNVRDVEQLKKSATKGLSTSKSDQYKFDRHNDADLKRIEEQLSHLLDTNIKLIWKKTNGEIRIELNNFNQLDQLIIKLNVLKN